MSMIKAGIKSVVKGIDEKERKISMLGTTEIIDRDNEVLSADGWELENFKSNPVVLFGHDHWTPAVGKAVVTKGKDGLMFDITFPPEGTYPLADTLFKLYKGGFMSASSVGFIPKEWVDADPEKAGEGVPRRKYTKQELIEISLVNVPANPSALITSRSFMKAWQTNAITAKDWDVLVGAVKDLGRVKGENLAAFINNAIEGAVTDDVSRDDVVAALVEAVGQEAVDAMLGSDQFCPTQEAMDAVAGVLGVSAEDIKAAAAQDGCTYDEGASTDGDEKNNQAVEKLAVEVNKRIDSIELAFNERMDALEEKLAKIFDDPDKAADYAELLLKAYRGKDAQDGANLIDEAEKAIKSFKP